MDQVSGYIEYWLGEGNPLLRKQFIDISVSDFKALFVGPNEIEKNTVLQIEFNKFFVSGDVSKLFKNFVTINSITFPTNPNNIDTQNVKNMGEMFRNCGALTSLDLSKFNTSSVTNMDQMFADYRLIKTLDLSNFDFRSVSPDEIIGYYGMFYESSHIVPLTVFVSDTFRVPALNWLVEDSAHGKKTLIAPNQVTYDYLIEIDSVGLRNFDIGMVGTGFSGSYTYNSAQYDFYNKSLQDFKSLGYNPTEENPVYQIQHATSIEFTLFKPLEDELNYMFDSFYATSIIFPTNPNDIDTSSVTNMDQMFRNCRALTSLDLSKFNTSGVTNMNAMFMDYRLIKTLDLSNFDFSSVTLKQDEGYYGMFYESSHIVPLTVFVSDTFSVPVLSWLIEDTGKWGNITLIAPNQEAYNDLIEIDSGGLDFDTTFHIGMVGTGFSGSYTYNSAQYDFYNKSLQDFKSLGYNPTEENPVYQIQHATSIEFTLFKPLEDELNDMFMDFQATSIIFPSNPDDIDTSSVTNMDQMFRNCGALTSLDLSKFNTISVTNMENMFTDYRLIKTLDLSNFNFSSVSPTQYYGGYYGMFYESSEIVPLIVFVSDTFRVPDLNWLVEDSNKWGNITLIAPNQDTYDYLIQKDSGDFGFDTTFHIGMVGTGFSGSYTYNSAQYDFYNKSRADFKSLGYNSAIGRQIQDATSIEFTLFKPLETDLIGLFRFFSKLTSITFPSNPSDIDTQRVTSLNSMFSECDFLTNIEFGAFNCKKVNYYGGMFGGSTLNTLDIFVGPNFRFNYTSTVLGAMHLFANPDGTGTGPYGQNITFHVPDEDTRKNISSLNKIEEFDIFKYTFDFQIVGGEAGADPYIKPIYGKLYKLPDIDAFYRLIQTDNIIVNAQVQSVDQSFINAKLKAMTDERFDVVQNHVYHWQSMHFFTKLCIMHNDEVCIYDMLNGTCVGSIPEWISFNATTNGTSALAMYQGEPAVKTSILNIADKLVLELAVYENPQVLSGVKIIKLPEKTDGLLIRRYSSESANLCDLYDTQVCKLLPANEDNIVTEIFYTNNGTQNTREIVVA